MRIAVQTTRRVSVTADADDRMSTQRPATPLLPGHAQRRIAQAAVIAAALAANAVAVFGATGRPFDLVILAAVFLASMLSSIAGFAFSAICGAMLFHLTPDHVRIVEVMLLCSVGNQAMMVWSLRRSIDYAALAPFLAGAVIGVPLGVVALLHANHATYTLAVGIFLLVYGLTMLLRPPIRLRATRARWDVLVGAVSGVIGGATATPGAFLAIWCGCKGWDKTRQRSTFQPFILIAQVFALAMVAALSTSGAHPIAISPADLLFVPAAIVGTRIGLAFFRRLSDRQFSLAVNTMLIVSGLSFVL